jgi:hypothetical protein
MEHDRAAPTPRGWSGLRAIATLRGLNARCFAMLAEVAHADATPIERSTIYREWELWNRVDQQACDLAARCPVLLLNLNFERLSWWSRVCDAGKTAPPPSTEPVLIEEAKSKPLLREILTEIWRLGHSLPGATTLLFGLAPGVCAEISGLSPADVDRIAISYAGELRPRWEDSCVFWRRLLEAATSADDEALFAVHLHCLQRKDSGNPVLALIFTSV